MDLLGIQGDAATLWTPEVFPTGGEPGYKGDEHDCSNGGRSVIHVFRVYWLESREVECDRCEEEIDQCHNVDWHTPAAEVPWALEFGRCG